MLGPVANETSSETSVDGSEKLNDDEALGLDAPRAGNTVGAVTSSCISPMLGGRAVAFAMIKWGLHEDGTGVMVPAEGNTVGATVQGLTFFAPQ